MFFVIAFTAASIHLQSLPPWRAAGLLVLFSESIKTLAKEAAERVPSVCAARTKVRAADQS
jgi:hypothetical protein